MIVAADPTVTAPTSAAPLPVQTIPLSRLTLSRDNPRRTGVELDWHRELVASIRAVGLLVRRLPDGERYAVEAGGRRLRAR